MNEIETWLESRIGLNFRSGLERMSQAISLLNHPEENYPIIHVTGTNGKGSTIAFMSQLFVQLEKKVGTFTSPHMVSVHDRICINHKPISDEDFTRLGRQVQEMERQQVRDIRDRWLVPVHRDLVLKVDRCLCSVVFRREDLPIPTLR